jgi:hypothetical protein
MGTAPLPKDAKKIPHCNKGIQTFYCERFFLFSEGGSQAWRLFFSNNLTI